MRWQREQLALLFYDNATPGPDNSRGSKDWLPIFCLGIDLGKTLAPGKEQEIIEVGKGPQLRRALPLRSDVAAYVKATAALVDDGPGVGTLPRSAPAIWVFINASMSFIPLMLPSLCLCSCVRPS